MIKERPILFSTPMVHAILKGRKTQTRRIVKPDLTIASHGKFNYKGREITGNSLLNYCPYGKPGDLLWVREAFRKPQIDTIGYMYRASVGESWGFKWKPSIHMPKAAARIWLRVTGIMVERLQDICDGDAKAEGIEQNTQGLYKCYELNIGLDEFELETPIWSFSSLWTSIHGSDSWEQNPWVWAITFEVVSTTGRENISKADSDLFINNHKNSTK